MNPQELAELPWVSFKNKVGDRWLPAERGESGWIFNDIPEAKELREELRKGSTTLKIGSVDFDVRISGGQGMFIQRSPVSEREHGKPRYGF